MSRLATEAEACREFARNIGEEFPERAWLLTSFDTWERNPAYTGPAVPHPEADYCDDGQGPREDYSQDSGGELDPGVDYDNEIPF